jgi:hypothetical protein
MFHLAVHKLFLRIEKITANGHVPAISTTTLFVLSVDGQWLFNPGEDFPD